MNPNGSHLRHNAFVYEPQDAYVARSVAFLREGLEAGEGAIVANTRPGLAVMREALGADAAQVTFIDDSAAYRRPARTLAGYHKIYADQLEKTPSLRAVADVQCGPDPGEWDLWLGYEAVFNRSFGHLPVWVLCSYDLTGLPDAVVDGVWRTHPEVVADNGWNTSEHYEDPDDVWRQIAPVPEPLSGLRSISFGRDLAAFRESLARELAAERVSPAKALDMLIAATEIAANAGVHGEGIEEVRVGRAEERFVCEIIDRGPGSTTLQRATSHREQGSAAVSGSRGS